MSNDILPSSVSLDQDQEEQAWILYEECGSMAEVARTLGVNFHHVRTALMRDPIRLMSVRSVRMERVANRWEQSEIIASTAMKSMLKIVEGMIAHIEWCKVNGVEETDLVDPKSKNRVKLTVTEAYQWLIQYGLVDSISRVGINAAKVVEAMHNLSNSEAGGSMAHSGTSKDPSLMSDEEIAHMVEDLEKAGRPLPWGVAQWKKAQDAKALRGRGKES